MKSPHDFMVDIAAKRQATTAFAHAVAVHRIAA